MGRALGRFLSQVRSPAIGSINVVWAGKYTVYMIRRGIYKAPQDFPNRILAVRTGAQAEICLTWEMLSTAHSGSSCFAEGCADSPAYRARLQEHWHEVRPFRCFLWNRQFGPLNLYTVRGRHSGLSVHCNSLHVT